MIQKILNVANDFKDILQELDQHLSNDVGKLPAIQHSVKKCKKETGVNYDTIVDLDVTSPLILMI